METTDAKSTITLFDRANSQLQKIYIFNIIIIAMYAFFAALLQICTSGDDPLFHNCFDGIVAGKMLPMQSIFHWLKQIEVRKHQIQTIE